MLENRMSARTKALLLALISLAAAVLFCGQFSGLELLPFGNDYDQAIYQQSTRSPPPPPPDLPPADPPEDDAGPPVFTVDQDNVEVRSGPSTEYPAIGVLNRGQTYAPHGRTPDGDWLQFTWEGANGWVLTQQLNVIDSDQLPVARDFPPPPPPPPGSPPSGPPPTESSPSDTLPPGSSPSDSPPPDSPPPDSSTPGSSPSGPTGPPPSE